MNDKHKMKHITSVASSDSSQSDPDLNGNTSQKIANILAKAKVLQEAQRPRLKDIVNNIEDDIKRNYRRSIVHRAMHPPMSTSTPCRSNSQPTQFSNVSSIGNSSSEDKKEVQVRKSSKISKEGGNGDVVLNISGFHLIPEAPERKETDANNSSPEDGVPERKETSANSSLEAVVLLSKTEKNRSINDKGDKTLKGENHRTYSRKDNLSCNRSKEMPGEEIVSIRESFTKDAERNGREDAVKSNTSTHDRSLRSGRKVLNILNNRSRSHRTDDETLDKNCSRKKITNSNSKNNSRDKNNLSELQPHTEKATLKIEEYNDISQVSKQSDKVIIPAEISRNPPQKRNISIQCERKETKLLNREDHSIPTTSDQQSGSRNEEVFKIPLPRTSMKKKIYVSSEEYEPTELRKKSRLNSEKSSVLKLSSYRSEKRLPPEEEVSSSSDTEWNKTGRSGKLKKRERRTHFTGQDTVRSVRDTKTEKSKKKHKKIKERKSTRRYDDYDRRHKKRRTIIIHSSDEESDSFVEQSKPERKHKKKKGSKKELSDESIDSSESSSEDENDMKRIKQKNRFSRYSRGPTRERLRYRRSSSSDSESDTIERNKLMRKRNSEKKHVLRKHSKYNANRKIDFSKDSETDTDYTFGTTRNNRILETGSNRYYHGGKRKSRSSSESRTYGKRIRDKEYTRGRSKSVNMRSRSNRKRRSSASEETEKFDGRYEGKLSTQKSKKSMATDRRVGSVANKKKCQLVDESDDRFIENSQQNEITPKTAAATAISEVFQAILQGGFLNKLRSSDPQKPIEANVAKARNDKNVNTVKECKNSSEDGNFMLSGTVQNVSEIKTNVLKGRQTSNNKKINTVQESKNSLEDGSSTLPGPIQNVSEIQTNVVKGEQTRNNQNTNTVQGRKNSREDGSSMLSGTFQNVSERHNTDGTILSNRLHTSVCAFDNTIETTLTQAQNQRSLARRPWEMDIDNDPEDSDMKDINFYYLRKGRKKIFDKETTMQNDGKKLLAIVDSLLRKKREQLNKKGQVTLKKNEDFENPAFQVSSPPGQSADRRKHSALLFPGREAKRSKLDDIMGVSFNSNNLSSRKKEGSCTGLMKTKNEKYTETTPSKTNIRRKHFNLQSVGTQSSPFVELTVPPTDELNTSFESVDQPILNTPKEIDKANEPEIEQAINTEEIRKQSDRKCKKSRKSSKYHKHKVADILSATDVETPKNEKYTETSPSKTNIRRKHLNLQSVGTQSSPFVDLTVPPTDEINTPFESVEQPPRNTPKEIDEANEPEIEQAINTEENHKQIDRKGKKSRKSYKYHKHKVANVLSDTDVETPKNEKITVLQNVTVRKARIRCRSMRDDHDGDEELKKQKLEEDTARKSRSCSPRISDHPTSSDAPFVDIEKSIESPKNNTNRRKNSRLTSVKSSNVGSKGMKISIPKRSSSTKDDVTRLTEVSVVDGEPYVPVEKLRDSQNAKISRLNSSRSTGVSNNNQSFDSGAASHLELEGKTIVTPKISAQSTPNSAAKSIKVDGPEVFKHGIDRLKRALYSTNDNETMRESPSYDMTSLQQNTNTEKRSSIQNVGKIVSPSHGLVSNVQVIVERLDVSKMLPKTIEDPKTNDAEQKPKKRGQKKKIVDKNKSPSGTQEQEVNEPLDGVRRSRRDRRPPMPCWWKKTITESELEKFGYIDPKNIKEGRYVGKGGNDKSKRRKRNLTSEKSSERGTSVENERPNQINLPSTSAYANEYNSQTDEVHVKKTTTKTTKRRKKEKEDKHNLTKKSKTRKNSEVELKEGTSAQNEQHNADNSHSPGGRVAESDNGYFTNLSCNESTTKLPDTSDSMWIFKKIVELKDTLTEKKFESRGIQIVDVGKRFNDKDPSGYLLLAPQERKVGYNECYCLTFVLLQGTCSLCLGQTQWHNPVRMFRIPQNVPYEIENTGDNTTVLYYHTSPQPNTITK